jgi:hypothetical protein
MPISQGDQLFLLVKSLTKSEKRSFTAFASRFQDSDDLLYVRLFDLLEKQKSLDEDALCIKLKIKDKAQFSNLKRHLYKQILASMRMSQISKNSDIQIREYLDFVDILYSRGLYLQSLKILDKAKSLAQKTKNDILYLSIVETEKTIESKHITRTGANITTELVNFTQKISETITNSSKLSNLRILLHGYYIQNGHVQNKEEEKQIVKFFDENMPELNLEQLSYIEQVYLNQSYVWYYYILLDFEKCLEYAEKWVALFHKSPEMIDQDPDLYMRGYHYLLTSTFNLLNKKKFNLYLNELEEFRSENYQKFTMNSKIISFLYVHHGRLNHHFLNKTYERGVEGLPKTLRRLSMYKNKLDSHRVMVFHFKIAWMYLMAKMPGKSVDYLNEIFKTEVGALREDIQTYSRLLFLMAHYDLGNENIMEYLIKTAKAHFEKSKQINKIQKATLLFFTKLVNAPTFERRKIFLAFDEELKGFVHDPYEKRAFLYLDLPQWIDKKLKRT